VIAIVCVAAVVVADARAEDVAKSRALVLEQAVKKYFLEHGSWPEKNNLLLVAPYLEGGQADLIDPWGEKYKLEIAKVEGAERPFVWTERVVGKEKKPYGRRPPQT
jgi:hypothetical protein